VRIERRMLSSERGYGRPVAKRPRGARSLLYSSARRFPMVPCLVNEAKNVSIAPHPN
jgi:hypothetical protein